MSYRKYVQKCKIIKISRYFAHNYDKKYTLMMAETQKR